MVWWRKADYWLTPLLKHSETVCLHGKHRSLASSAAFSSRPAVTTATTGVAKSARITIAITILRHGELPHTYCHPLFSDSLFLYSMSFYPALHTKSSTSNVAVLVMVIGLSTWSVPATLKDLRRWQTTEVTCFVARGGKRESRAGRKWRQRRIAGPFV